MVKPGQKLTIATNRSYFLTSTVINWFKVFENVALCDLVIESLRFCIHHKGLNIYSYCIMPSHLHLVANCNEPCQLKDTIRDFKRHTARICFDYIQENSNFFDNMMIQTFIEEGESSVKNKTIKFWQVGNHAIELYSERFSWWKIEYIHQNPVKAGLVDKPEKWKYSSASNYKEMDSVLPEVIRVRPPLNF